VRLAGCNLRCSWCDSEYTFKGGYKQSLDEVEAAVAALTPVRLVEFTGGEPMLQERELVPLMERMLNKGYTLMIETSGERLLGNVPKDVHKIVDVKCPGSGEGGTFRMENVDALTKRDEVKFVISDRGDYEFAREFTREHGLEERAGAVLFSPAFKKAPSLERSTSNCALDPRVLVEWMLADGVPARLSLQIHKYIWEPQKKGV
jgi:7-carboxy-7-deazaguanine synthase